MSQLTGGSKAKRQRVDRVDPAEPPVVFTTLKGTGSAIVATKPPATLSITTAAAPTAAVAPATVTAPAIDDASSLRAWLEQKFTGMEQKFDQKFTEMEQAVDQKFNAIAETQSHKDLFAVLTRVSTELHGSHGTFIWLDGCYYLLTCFHCVWRNDKVNTEAVIPMILPADIFTRVHSIHIHKKVACDDHEADYHDIIFFALSDLPPGKEALVITLDGLVVGDKVTGLAPNSCAFADVLVCRTPQGIAFIETTDFSNPGYSGMLACCPSSGHFGLVQGYSDSTAIQDAVAARKAKKSKDVEAEIKAIVRASRVHSHLVRILDPRTLPSFQPTKPYVHEGTFVNFNIHLKLWDSLVIKRWQNTTRTATD